MIVLRNRGFTLVEMMLYLVLSGLLLGGIYALLLGQGRAYGKQRELMDVHSSIRAAAALLAWEIRQVSAADGDLYAIGANSITLRSVQGTGVVCKKHPVLPRFGIKGEPGDMTATVDDSALVFSAGLPGAGDDVWKVLRITAVNVPGTIAVGTCAYLAAGMPEVSVTVTAAAPIDTAGIAVGALFRAFRRVEYGIYLDGGRWWLGRKVGGAVTYEKVTGPLLPQGSGGLVFTYANANGVPTVDPTQVATVDFVIRAESYVRPAGQANYQADSLATRIATRG